MKIFVYGTLKRGGSNHACLRDQEFLGEACTVPGFTLYSLGSYPGMVPDLTDRHGVAGEVWSVDEKTLAELDALEGLAEGLYTRSLIPLRIPFATDTVETYFYARGLAAAQKIGPLWLE